MKDNLGFDYEFPFMRSIKQLSQHIQMRTFGPHVASCLVIWLYILKPRSYSASK
jgi:hypothetical protein